VFVVVFYVLSVSFSQTLSDFDFSARNLIRSLDFNLFWPNIYEHILSDIVVFLYLYMSVKLSLHKESSYGGLDNMD
jgi:hypothetical protein